MDGYERIRSQRRGDRGWGVELLRRQGLAAWVEVAIEHAPPLRSKRLGDVVALSVSGESGEAKASENVSMVRVLADVTLARLREERS